MSDYGYHRTYKNDDGEVVEDYKEHSYQENNEEGGYSYHHSSSKTTHTSSYSYSSNKGHPRLEEEEEGGRDNEDPEFTEEDYKTPNPNYPQPPHTKHNPGPDPVEYGGMVTHQDEQAPEGEDNSLYLHVNSNVAQHGIPDFELSNCEGRKRALLIGINYTGTKNALNGCINDVQNIKNFIIKHYGFKEEDMVILTDDQEEDKFKPTRANIIAGMKWLVHDADANDSFLFHYSGHGGRVADQNGDEDDGYDETIYPLDFESFDGESGQIIDDDLHGYLIKPLPPKCRLTAIFDSCHSGTVLDLPFTYSTRGQLKEQNLFKVAGQGLLTAGLSYAQGDKDGALKSIFSLGKQLFEAHEISDESRKNNFSKADVVMFSGCKDDQTSADASEAGKATGAMSHAFIEALRENPEQSYQQLLNSVRDILRDKYAQRPQLSSSHPIDVNLKFII